MNEDNIANSYRSSWHQFSECSSQTESLINWCVRNGAILSHDYDKGYILFTIDGIGYKFSDDWMGVWWFMAGWDCNEKGEKNPKFELRITADNTIYITVHGKKHEIFKFCSDSEDMLLVKMWMDGYEARCD